MAYSVPSELFRSSVSAKKKKRPVKYQHAKAENILVGMVIVETDAPDDTTWHDEPNNFISEILLHISGCTVHIASNYNVI